MSGNLYTWTTEHKYKSSSLPTFSTLKQLKDTTIYASKPKNRFPVVHRWTIGHGPITALAFSPDTTHIAVANQDGFLRIYNFHKMELYGRMRSHYGGFLCVCWSPDGKYVVTGSEDDLVSVWSYFDKRVVTRGEGHHSYVNAVTFDPYVPEQTSLLIEDDLETAASLTDLKSRSSRFIEGSQSYRVGSVGQDGLLCLWELSGNNLTVHRRGYGWSRSRIPTSIVQAGGVEEREEDGEQSATHPLNDDQVLNDASNTEASIGSKSSEKESKSKKKPKKRESSDSTDMNPTDPDVVSDSGLTETSSVSSDSTKVKKKKKPSMKSAVKKVKNFMTGGHDYAESPRHFISAFESCQSDDIAPKMTDINVVEPLVCKKVWSERLTDIVFREDCFLIATEDGYVQLWARPGRCPEDGGVAHVVPSNPGVSYFM